MKVFLDYMLSSILPGKDYKIEESSEEDRIDLIIKAPKEYMGLIIGKEGKTISSLRQLLKVRATVEKKMVNLSVEESTS